MRVLPGPVDREPLQVDEVVVDLHDRVARPPPDNGRLGAHNRDRRVQLAIAFSLEVFVVLFVRKRSKIKKRKKCIKVMRRGEERRGEERRGRALDIGAKGLPTTLSNSVSATSPGRTPRHALLVGIEESTFPIVPPGKVDDTRESNSRKITRSENVDRLLERDQGYGIAE